MNRTHPTLSENHHDCGAPYYYLMIGKVLKLYLAPFSSGSQVTMISILKRISCDIGCGHLPIERTPWPNIDITVVKSLVGKWEVKLSPATLKIYLFAIREISRCCFLEGAMGDLQYADIKSFRLESAESRGCSGHYVSFEERKKLIYSCVSDHRKNIGLRDHAALALLFSAGLRCTEAINLKPCDIKYDSATLVIKKEDTLNSIRHLEAWAVLALKKWLDVTREHPNAGSNIIQRINKNGDAVGDIGISGLYKTLRSRCLLAQVEHMSPQDARYTRGIDLIQQHGLIHASQALGHKSISTTERYISR
ncbi:site-specific integrase [Pseudomonas lurida]|uniref:tyrosine-type recombinase/integrase n=1 Tax=Pseudomonas lurida TaxID=244566 RepID=UPI001644021D|nr:site-specific integrase [Pseudomonas lurida]MBC3239457.1 site-specific integrase [Pseudomonas lurida]